MTAILSPPIFNDNQKGAVRGAHEPSSTNVFLTDLDGQQLQQTINQSWTVGSVTDNYIYFFANVTGLTSTPSIRYNKVKKRWEFDSGDGVFLPLGGGSSIARSYTHIQSVPSNTWNILHNMDDGILVTITDEFHNVIKPDEVQVIDQNSLVITFSTPIQGFAYIIKQKYTIAISNRSSWIIPHNQGTFQVTYNVFDTNGFEILPDTATLTDLNTLTLTFGQNVSGTCNVAAVGFEYINGAASSDWILDHNLASRALGYLITDTLREQIEADVVTFTTENSMEVQFSQSIDGYVEVVEG